MDERGKASEMFPKLIKGIHAFGSTSLPRLILQDYSETEAWQEKERALERESERCRDREPIMRASVDSGPTSCRATVDIMKINHLSYHRDTERARLEAEVTFFFFFLPFPHIATCGLE